MVHAGEGAKPMAQRPRVVRTQSSYGCKYETPMRRELDPDEANSRQAGKQLGKDGFCVARHGARACVLGYGTGSALEAHGR